MLKLLQILCIVVVVSCTKTKGRLDLIGGPSWIFDPYSTTKTSDEIAGVGMSEQTKVGLKMQLAQAENDAIANIASQIQTKVHKTVIDNVQSSENASNSLQDEHNKLKKAIEFEKKFSIFTKNVVDKLPVLGAKRTDIWQDTRSGTLYVRMVVDKSKLEKYLKDNIKMYKNIESYGVKRETIENVISSALGDKSDYSSKQEDRR